MVVVVVVVVAAAVVSVFCVVCGCFENQRNL